MVGIGIRVFSESRVYYCILKNESSGIRIEDISFVNIPMALDRPERLSFTRNTLLDIFRLYDVSNAIVRISEGRPGRPKGWETERTYIEGVMQEALAGCNVTKFKAARINELQKIGSISNFKEMAEGKSVCPVYPDGNDWKKKLNLEERESFLAAIISLSL